MVWWRSMRSMFTPGARGSAWEAFVEGFGVEVERLDLQFTDFAIGAMPPEVGTVVSATFRRILWNEERTRITDVADQDVDILVLPVEVAPGAFALGYGDVRLVVEPARMLLRLRRLALALAAEARRAMAPGSARYRADTEPGRPASRGVSPSR